MTAFTTSSGCSWISQWAGVQLDLLVRPGDELGLQVPDLLPREDLEISCAEDVENGPSLSPQGEPLSSVGSSEDTHHSRSTIA